VREDIGEPLQSFPALLAIGSFGIYVTDAVCTPLDEGPLMRSVLALLCISALLAASTRRIRSVAYIGFARRMVACVGLVLVLSSAFIILNGALDSYPPLQVETQVIQKSVGARSSYHLVVSPSWREGRDHETFQVRRATFDDVQMGDSIQVVVHRGAFWVPWRPRVLGPTR
jgi:hypothetical protein